MSFTPDEHQEGMYPPPINTSPVFSQGPGGTASASSIGGTLRNLFEIYKRVLQQHSVAAFEAELPAANWQAIWIGAGILALAWSLLTLVAGLEQSSSGISSGPSIGAMVGVFVVSVIAVFVAAAIYHGIARLFGGTASFLTYAYAISLVLIPIDTIDAFALMIPVLGVLITFGVGIYGLYLLVLATQAAHRLPMNKAVATVLIPAGVATLLSCAFYSLIAVFALLLIHAAQ